MNINYCHQGLMRGIANPERCGGQNLKKNNNMQEIIGGQTVTGAIVDGIVNLFKAIYNIGRGAGGSIRRIATGNVCPLQKS